MSSALSRFVADVITKATLTANSILGAVTSGVPTAISLAASQLIGRKATGDIGALSAADVQTICGAFGYGQTWQDVTASRASGNTYTNSTGRPIQVCISGTYTVTVVVGGVTIGIDNGITDANVSFVVPNGATYSATCTYQLLLWTELR